MRKPANQSRSGRPSASSSPASARAPGARVRRSSQREPERRLAPPAPLDTDTLERLRRQRLSLGRTVASSRDYWADVNRVLQMRHSLEQAEGRFRELYDFIPIPFLVLDGKLRLVSANAAAAALVGEDGIALGQHLVTLVDSHTYRQLTASLAASGSAKTLDGSLRTRTGWAPVQIAAQATDPDTEGLVRTRIYYVAVVDLSELRRVTEERRRLELEQQRSREAERVAREASQAKDEFLAMLSHELRTPLTPILAAASALDTKGLPRSVCEAIAAIRRNVLAEARLVDDLLDVQRIRQRRLTIERRRFRLHRLLAQVIRDWKPEAERKRLAVDVTLAAGVDHVDADAGRLAQVFRNLLGNATKFTDAGGRIQVRTANRDGRICVSIEDTGAGMTAQQLNRLFQPFSETSSPWDARAGLGLGLVISHGIVDAHGGRIRAESRGPRKGTCVEVELETLPVPADAELAPPDVSRSAALPHAPASAVVEPVNGRQATAPAKPRVLLVEDHADSAETLSMVLSMKGYDVKVAPTVAEARAIAASCDLLISDISLPDGSGLDLMRELRRRRPVRGIALSGFGTEDDVRRSREAGFAEHLIKPVDIDRLLATIERVVGEEMPAR